MMHLRLAPTYARYDWGGGGGPAGNRQQAGHRQIPAAAQQSGVICGKDIVV